MSRANSSNQFAAWSSNNTVQFLDIATATTSASPTPKPFFRFLLVGKQLSQMALLLKECALVYSEYDNSTALQSVPLARAKLCMCCLVFL